MRTVGPPHYDETQCRVRRVGRRESVPRSPSGRCVLSVICQSVSHVCVVSNTDDMEMPVNTARAFIIGFFWAVLIPALNQVRDLYYWCPYDGVHTLCPQFMYFRYPSTAVGSVRPPVFFPPTFLTCSIAKSWSRSCFHSLWDVHGHDSCLL